MTETPTMPSTHRAHGCRSMRWMWEGLNLLTIENSRIRVTFWLDRGGDIIEFRDKASDIDVLWKNPLCWPPQKRSLDLPKQSRVPLYDVLHGGWFTSLPNGFFPGDYCGVELGCHGELLALPVAAEILDGGSGAVGVRLTGRCVRTPFVYVREVWLRESERTVAFHEQLQNCGGTRLPVAWLHHPAFGGEFLEGARFVSAATRVVVPNAGRPQDSQLKPGTMEEWPHARLASGALRDCSEIPPAGSPVEHAVHWEKFTRGWGAIWNERRGLGFGLRWDESIFPRAWSWICCGGTGYPLWGRAHVATIQPSTSPLRAFDDLVADDEVLWIEPGCSVRTALTAGFVTGEDEVHQLPSENFTK